ncbi:type II toxin-antitoxin system death-on-curing family toxin [Streptomyces sp. PmtA]|uniref:type II toxin-antitoxin system death-on-curing family toxin n=1 Tax=Streptomyces sp. PmtA TaxID=3074275 RepID=UPI003FCCA995
MTHQTTTQTRHLTVSEVTAIARFAFGGHPPELRAGGLLESAVHRPRSRMYGVAAYPDLWEQAGALLHAIASNHPFVDGNQAHGVAVDGGLPRPQRRRPRQCRPGPGVRPGRVRRGGPDARSGSDRGRAAHPVNEGPGARTASVRRVSPRTVAAR